jgi:hypothetical protein
VDAFYYFVDNQLAQDRHKEFAKQRHAGTSVGGVGGGSGVLSARLESDEFDPGTSLLGEALTRNQHDVHLFPHHHGNDATLRGKPGVPLGAKHDPARVQAIHRAKHRARMAGSQRVPAKPGSAKPGASAKKEEEYGLQTSSPPRRPYTCVAHPPRTRSHAIRTSSSSSSGSASVGRRRVRGGRLTQQARQRKERLDVVDSLAPEPQYPGISALLLASSRDTQNIEGFSSVHPHTTRSDALQGFLNYKPLLRDALGVTARVKRAQAAVVDNFAWFRPAAVARAQRNTRPLSASLTARDVPGWKNKKERICGDSDSDSDRIATAQTFYDGYIKNMTRRVTRERGIVSYARPATARALSRGRQSHLDAPIKRLTA